MSATGTAEEIMAAIAGDRGARNGSAPVAYTITVDAKGKLLFPDLPAHNDPRGLCAWVTRALNLDPRHPVRGATHEGLRGPDGHVVLARREAVAIRFEPASKMNNPPRLIETLSWWKIPTDGLTHAYKAGDCRLISHAVRMLCGAHRGMTEAQQAEAIVADLMQAALAVCDRTTYGTPAQRYEAAIGLRRERDEATGRPLGPPRYLIDQNTGELVIAVSDLAEAARRHVGSSLARGWLDARMETLGWARIVLDGHEMRGRGGRQGAHARVFAYRGLLSAVSGGSDDTEAVTT